MQVPGLCRLLRLARSRR